MTPEPPPLHNFACRLQQEPDFMAHILQTYREQEHLDEQQMAVQLGIDRAAYSRLAICRVPRQDPLHFSADLQRIATAIGANLAMLVRVIRTVQAVTALRAIPAAEPQRQAAAPRLAAHPGLLAAARDRDGEAMEELPPDVDGPPANQDEDA